MAKQLIETTGSFELVDYAGTQTTLIQASRPTVAESTPFVASRAAIGQIKFLENLNDEATDEEFAKYWSESNGDRALAIESFKAAYGIGAEPKNVVADEEEETPRRRGRKGQPSNTESFTSDASTPQQE